MLNLDTHIVVHLLDGSLTGREKELLDDQAAGISAIVLWELAKLHQKGRIAFGPDDLRIRSLLNRCATWPIDVRVAVMSTQLDFASDPADEIIAATSIIYRAPLLTRDARLRASNLVPLAI